MSKPWTIEVQQPDGTWRKMAPSRISKAWRYATAENAMKDTTSKHGRKFFQGANVRPALIEEVK